MLADFIETNLLKARIIPKRVANENGAICKLFVSEKTELFLVVHRYHNKIDLNKLHEVFLQFTKEKVHEADSPEAERITGYRAEYMSPVSIYGVRLLIDKKALGKELYCFIAEEETLVISADEILEMNELYSVVDITKD